MDDLRDFANKTGVRRIKPELLASVVLEKIGYEALDFIEKETLLNIKNSVFHAGIIKFGVGYDKLPIEYRNSAQLFKIVMIVQNPPYNQESGQWFIRYAGTVLQDKILSLDPKLDNLKETLKVLAREEQDNEE